MPKVRAIFLSDVHLGTRNCQADRLLAFLHEYESDYRYLLIHGDSFDAVARCHGLLVVLGEHGYSTMMAMNRLLSRLRRTLGRPGYWSFSAAIKRNLKHARADVRDYEYAVARHAAELGFDGVICGHIHGADKAIERVRYLHCGDWVDRCSAVVEHLDGRIELLSGSAATLPDTARDHRHPGPQCGGVLPSRSSRPRWRASNTITGKARTKVTAKNDAQPRPSTR